MAIKIFIDEPFLGLVDRTDWLFYGDQATFNLIKGQRGTADFSFVIPSSIDYRPTKGTQVFIHELVGNASPTDTIVFAGTIDSFRERWIGDYGYVVFSITCVSLDQTLDVIRIPPTAYFNETAGDILTDLFNTYIAPLGVPVTLGTVQAGPTIDSFVIRWDRFNDLAQKLATIAQFITGVQMSDQTLFFQEQTTTPAPFTVRSYLWESGDWNETRVDFRDRQLIQIAFTAFSTSNEMIPGDGTSGFVSLFRRVDRITSACLTTSTQATAQGIFGTSSPLSPAQPSPGDTFRIGPSGEEPYTFVTSLDNTLRNQILIGATVNDTAINTFHAINATQIWKGVKFSLPTWENDQCNADLPSGNVFVIRCKNPGTGGNGILLTTTSATFVWSAGGLADGTDGVSNALRVGILGAGDTGNDILYQSGSNQLLLAAPVQVGETLSVAYYALGADTIAVEDSALVAIRAAVEDGSGRYDQLITDTNNTEAISAYVEAVNALTAYKTLPSSFSFSIDQALLAPGQLLTISIVSPAKAPVLLNGTWLVQEIQATLIPGMESLPEPFGHFRYKITVINVPVVGTFVDFFQNLAIVTPAGSQTASNGTTIQVATPTLKDPTTAPAGAPVSGTPSQPAGQQWVQEAPGMYRIWKAKDLVVDAADDTKVTSASRPFVAGDVGSYVIVTGGAGWTTGTYTISAVVGVIATLSGSPAAVSTTHGEWELRSPGLLALSWVPLASAYTGNQIVILEKNGLELSPFDPTEVGYVEGGGDYLIINKNQIQLAVPASGGDVFIATYFPNGIVKAPEGPEAPPVSASLFLVAHDDGASAGDIVMTSPDGSTWTSQNTPLPDSGKTVAFGAGVYVLGADFTSTTEQIATSPDGVTWTLQSSPADNGHVNKIIFANSQFVALYKVGSTNGVMTSPDGVTWTAQTITSTGTAWADLAYGAGVYVAVGNGSSTTSIMSSPDAVTWTNRSVAVTPQFTCVAFGAGVFAALGGVGGSGIHLHTSPDGITWTSQADPAGDTRIWNGVVFGGSQFVAVTTHGSSPQAMTSNDGVTWSTQTTPSTRNWQAVGYGNSLYVAVANQSSSTTLAVMTSPDGITWTTQTTPSAGFCKGVTFG